MTKTAKLAVSSENEIISDGTDIGKLVQIGNYVYTQKDFAVAKSLNSLAHSCPVGWRPMNLDELNNLINYKTSTTEEYFLNTAYLTMTSSNFYFANSKSFTNVDNGGDINDWAWKAIKFSNNVPSIVDQETFFPSATQMKTKCIRDMTHS